MRIRFTLDIERAQKPAVEPPDIYDLNGSQTERPGWQPMGFTVPHGIPDDHEDRA